MGEWVKERARGRVECFIIALVSEDRVSVSWWEKKKSVRSERGQGGSVVVNADKLSQRRPLTALYPKLHRKCGVTGRYFLPSLLLVSLCTHLLSQSASNLHSSILNLRFGSLKSYFSSILFFYLLSFSLFSFPFLFISFAFFHSLLVLSFSLSFPFFSLSIKP